MQSNTRLLFPIRAIRGLSVINLSKKFVKSRSLRQRYFNHMKQRCRRTSAICRTIEEVHCWLASKAVPLRPVRDVYTRTSLPSKTAFGIRVS